MGVEKFTVSRDDSVYECFPSLTQLKSGRLVLVYRESDGHGATNYCRLIVRTSDDKGKTFSVERVLVDSKRADGRIIHYNCPKVQQLRDGRVLISCDVYPNPPGENYQDGKASHIMFWFSGDDGKSWAEPVDSGVRGIMPDEVIQLDSGDWLLATQFLNAETKEIMQCVSRSADGGKTWQEPIIVASRGGYNFCEGSIVQMPGGELVCYMRENSNMGRPIYKCISKDGGKTWEGPFVTQMDAGHRPVAHLTRSGKVLITYRHQIGGRSPMCKNVFSFMESTQSALNPERNLQSGILLPLDHDRNSNSDAGYTGCVETQPGEFLAVSYIKDDAPMAQIRGYRFSERDF